MKVGIIGGGAIGLLVASHLAVRHDVSLYVRRKEQMNSVRTNSIWRSQGDLFAHAGKMNIHLEKNLQKEDLYIICVKQHHLEELLPVLQKLETGTNLLFLQNGMGHLILLDRLQTPTYVGVVSHGAKRVSDWEVHHLGLGSIQIATYGKKAKNARQLATMLHQADFPFHYTANWDPLLKHKLLVNAVINPLTAIFDVPNGDILTHPEMTALAKRLCNEAADVLKISTQEAWRNICDIAYSTRENTSSMRADIHLGRPTEIDAITGYLLREAKKPLPFSNYVYDTIKELQKRSK